MTNAMYSLASDAAQSICYPDAGIADPGGAVAEGDDLAVVLAAAAQVLGFHQPGEGVLAVEGGQVAGGAGVRHRVAVVVQPGHGEEPGELDLAGAGCAVLCLALPAGGLAGAHRDAGPVRLGMQHVGQRPGRGQRHDPPLTERGGLGGRGGAGGGAGGLGGPLDGLGAEGDAGQAGQQPGGAGEGGFRAGQRGHLGQARRQRRRAAGRAAGRGERGRACTPRSDATPAAA
jgi:hypothetical protein